MAVVQEPKYLMEIDPGSLLCPVEASQVLAFPLRDLKANTDWKLFAFLGMHVEGKTTMGSFHYRFIELCQKPFSRGWRQPGLVLCLPFSSLVSNSLMLCHTGCGT